MIGVLDCNNFFVSCERLFRPDIWRRPVAVLSSNDGCIVARSQEVKDLGIPMGVPYFQVKDICNKEKIVLFSSNFTLYRDISSRVMSTLRAQVGDCEVYSIDEAFFAVPDSTTEEDLASLRATIIEKTGIPVSIGVAATKTIAKLASKQAKKGSGVSILTGEDWKLLAASIPCSEVWGIGRQLSVRLREHGIDTVGDYQALSRPQVRKLFGVVGERMQSELTEVSVYQVGDGEHEPQQSVTSSRSFAKSVSKLSHLESVVSYHVAHVARKLREEGLLASRMSVYIRPSRHGDFAGTRGHKEIDFSYPSSSTRVLTRAALTAVREVYDSAVPYKKAGVVMGGLVPERYVPTPLFDSEVAGDERALDTLLDNVNARYGNETIHLASEGVGGSLASAKLRSPAYTTRWSDIPTVSA